MSSRRAAAGGHDRDHARGEGAQRRVEDVEGRGPAGALVADDDARAHDRRRHLAAGRDERLGLVLGALVGVAEPAAAGVVLVDDAAPVSGDVRGGHVREALEAGARRGEVDHLPRALDVDPPRLLERQVERDRRRAVDDRADALGQRLPALAEPEPRRGDVARHGRDPVRVGVGVAARRLEGRGQALRRPVVVLGADQRDDVPVGALEHAREHLHADEAGRAGQQ